MLKSLENFESSTMWRFIVQMITTVVHAHNRKWRRWETRSWTGKWKRFCRLSFRNPPRQTASKWSRAVLLPVVLSNALTQFLSPVTLPAYTFYYALNLNWNVIEKSRRCLGWVLNGTISSGFCDRFCTKSSVLRAFTDFRPRLYPIYCAVSTYF